MGVAGKQYPQSGLAIRRHFLSHQRPYPGDSGSQKLTSNKTMITRHSGCSPSIRGRPEFVGPIRSVFPTNSGQPQITVILSEAKELGDHGRFFASLRMTLTPTESYFAVNPGRAARDGKKEKK
jgi:hypothetical protein